MVRLTAAPSSITAFSLSADCAKAVPAYRNKTTIKTDLGVFTSASRLLDATKCGANFSTITPRQPESLPQCSPGEALPSASVIEFVNGQSICGNVWLGLCDLEAGFLSGEAGFGEISGLLRVAAEFRRAELYVPAIPTAKLLNGWIERRLRSSSSR